VHLVAVTLPSTVAEHRDLVIRGHVLAKAPGRSEGSRELRDRVVVRSRDTRSGACNVAQVADATRTWPSAASRTRTTRLQASGPLPSVLPGPSRSRRRDCRAISATAGRSRDVDAVDPAPWTDDARVELERARLDASHLEHAGRPPSTVAEHRDLADSRATSSAKGPPGRSTTGVAMQSATAWSCAHATRAAASCKPRAKADAMLHHALCCVADANHEARKRRASPLGPAVALRVPLAARPRARDARPMKCRAGLVPAVVRSTRPHGPCSGRGSSTRGSMPCTSWPSRRRARSPSIATS
jgi:hypothetical protein